MLKVTDKKRSAGTMDNQVKSLVHQICRLWDQMEDFERLFKLKLPEMKSLNQFGARHAYTLDKIGNNTIEVWHVNIDHVRDRLLCVVEYVPEEISE